MYLLLRTDHVRAAIDLCLLLEWYHDRVPKKYPIKRLNWPKKN